MKSTEYSEIEKEMLNFDFKSIEPHVAHAKAALSTRGEGLSGGLDKLCEVWKKIGKFIKLLEKVPVIGKYVSILAEILDSICPA